jgi:hypothetical protein
MSYFGHIGSYSHYIAPHSFLAIVYIETPAVFKHRKLVVLLKIPIGIFLYVP